MYEIKGHKYSAKTMEIFGYIVMLMLIHGSRLIGWPVALRTLDKIHELIADGKFNTQRDIERESEEEPAIRLAFK